MWEIQSSEVFIFLDSSMRPHDKERQVVQLKTVLKSKREKKKNIHSLFFFNIPLIQSDQSVWGNQIASVI